ncbi:AMP-dependent synthetase/ligase [Rhodococcus qingshengii]|uniref:AMP-dependent synthetase/ligase n=1 Tax=Rhodococcus qingshengii TaxID=334542 RepID=UPI0010A63900|nr:AMP-dependent synthetase/ligase [Rhodococcus qingshengii]THJ67698.1 long-chain fatty acid--CoA ligase [Rhodococcus qingshengii]
MTTLPVAASTDRKSPARLPLTASTLVEAFQLNVERNADRLGLRSIGGGVEFTWAEVATRVENIASGLWARGMRKGDTVAILATNSIENHVVDLAIAHLGAIPFGIFNSSSKEQIAYQVENGGARFVLTEKQFLPKVQEAVNIVGNQVGTLIVLDDESSPNATALTEIEATPADDFDFEASWRGVDIDDLQCMIYTSGTTGPPKAVEWSNRTVMAQLRSLDSAIPLPTDNLISFLPMAHAGGRINGPHTAIVHGAAITACPVMADVPLALIDARPDALFSSPRVFEKLQVAIEGLIAKEEGSRLSALNDAVQTGMRIARAEEAGSTTKVEMDEALVRDRARGLELLAPILRQLGLDKLKVAIIGGAPVSADVVHFFRAVGVPMLEAYGETETSLNVFNRVDDFKTATAGKPLPGVEVKLGPDNELLARSEMNMVGYRNDSVKTAETLDDDGWVHTGDIAHIDDDGFIAIVDRKKELIINSAGKNMSPANIEMTILGQSSLIAQVVAIGDGRRFVTALITVDMQAVETAAARLGVDSSDIDFISSPGIRNEIAGAIERGNALLNSNEQIKKFAIVSSAWLPDSEELTPTAKLKRRTIHKKYSAEIERLYA